MRIRFTLKCSDEGLPRQRYWRRFKRLRQFNERRILSPMSDHETSVTADATHAATILVRWVFLRILGLVYLVAFSSFWTQAMGLIGTDGIAPATEYVSRLREAFERDPNLSWLDAPTLFLIVGASDVWIHCACLFGVVLSFTLLFGLAPRLSILGLWVGYLSLFVIPGLPWYQWDILLLEVSCFHFSMHQACSGRIRHVHSTILSVWLLQCVFKLILSSGLSNSTVEIPLGRT